MEVDEDDYGSIAQNKKAKKRIVVPLDPEGDKDFQKFLERENYVPDYSFPIDMDENEKGESESFMIPSANFMVLHDEVMERNRHLMEQ